MDRRPSLAHGAIMFEAHSIHRRTSTCLRRVRLATTAALAGLSAAACSQAADDGTEGLDDVSAVAVDGPVDFADYMLPNCSGPGTPQYIAPQVFRTVPLGGNRFAVVKNQAGNAFEDWTFDGDWLRIWADNTWAYQMNGQWCDTECRQDNQHPGTPCNRRWAGEPADYANTLYRDPDNGANGAPFIRRRMNFSGGAFSYTAQMSITGQHRDGCGWCPTNFDSPRVSRAVTARRYSSRAYNTPCGTNRTFSDVIELYVNSGPGEGETAVYARGEGFIGFGGRGEQVLAACWPDPSIPTPAPIDVCGGGAIASVCAELGRGGGGCPCLAGTDNVCNYQDGGQRAACGLPGDRPCQGDEWGVGWYRYREACGL
jgi:hypothetical protein